MVKRQCIILLLTCNIMICAKTNAGAWTNAKGKWSAFYTGEHSVLPTKTLKNNHAQQNKIYNEIIANIKFLRLKKEYYKRLNIPIHIKLDRIAIIDQQLKFLLGEKNKYVPYIYKDAKSFTIEYGLQKNLSIGIKSLTCNGWNKQTYESTSEELGGFIKAQIWQKEKRVIAVQPYIGVSRSNNNAKNTISTELRILSSHSNYIKSRFFKKHTIEKFTNYDFAVQASNHKPYTKFCSEISQGLKFANEYYIIWQNIYHISNQSSKLLRQTLREQLSIAKTISTKNNKKANIDQARFTLQTGYFNEMSLTYKQPLSSGVFLSLWMQT